MSTDAGEGAGGPAEARLLALAARPGWLRGAGWALLLAAALGLLLSAGGLVLVWLGAARVEAAGAEGIATLREALATTAAGLEVADDALSGAEGAVGAIDGALLGADRTAGAALGMVETGARLLEGELPQILADVESALRSAERGAGAADRMLSAAARIPLLGLDAYQPETPLAEGIGGAADGVARLEPVLSEAIADLEAAAEGVAGMRGSTDELGGSIGRLGGSVAEARLVVADYQALVTSLQGSLDELAQLLPRWLAIARVAGTLAMLWLGIVQLAVFGQGLDMLARASELRGMTV